MCDDPTRTRQGLCGAFASFAFPPMLVLVDARNVLRSRWPNLPEDELLERCCAWAADRTHRALVVFDGKAPSALVGERDVGESCTAVGTGGESADDWLTRKAAELEARVEPYWLVTSDRALRRRAGQAAERIVGGGSFVRELGAARDG